MAKDLLYTNGVIAAREKYLLNDKIFKLCDSGAEEALRAVSESGFGKGVEVASVYEYEKLVSADEAAIDGFIREYAPSRAEAAYLLSPRDFHNAKAAVKAKYLNLSTENMLAPAGLIPAEEVVNSVNSGDLKPLGEVLGEAVKQSAALFSEENESQASGAEIGIIFEKALYKHLHEACARNGLLKKLLATKADMTNILTVLRSDKEEYAAKSYVTGGKISEKQLASLFDEDSERALKVFKATPYYEFVKKCIADKAAGLPLTTAERICESYETEYFTAKKYELQKNQPFLYYVFRRRAENANVRILFVCLLAGMNESEIKRRLRAIQ
ncbi:MAG: V-type ATPase subunit [Clostridia bacterium]|nr:V-type ATPase subunit [Clostridia bacterium]